MSNKNKKTKPAVAEIPAPVPASNMLKNRLALVIFIFSFVLYAQSIAFDFVLDDEASIKENRLVQQGIPAIPTLLKTDSWYGANVGVKIPIYRPGSFVLFATIWQFFPDSPHVYHLINVLLYALTCALLFLLLSKLFSKQSILFPFACVLLYAAHPIHTEVVNNIKSADEILCLLFGIAAMFPAIKFTGNRSPLQLFLLALFYFLSVLSKESGIIFVVAIPLTVYFFTDAKSKSIFIVSLLLLLTAAVHLFIRAQVLEGIPAYDRSPLVNTLYAAPDFVSEKATALFILLKYILLLIFPHPLSYNYDYAQIPMQQLANPAVIFSLLVHAALLVYAIAGLKKKSIVSFAILFYLLALAPVSNMFIIIASTLGERLMYMPSLGYCIIVAYVIMKILKADLRKRPETIKSFFSSNKKILIPVILIACLYSVKTFSRSGDWKDNPTLFGHDVKVSSGSATAHFHWGNALQYMLYDKQPDEARKQNLEDEAIAEYQKAIQIYPGYMDAYKHLGVGYSRKGDNANALKYFEKHNEFTGRSDLEVLQMEGNLYDKTAQYDKAIEAFTLVVQRQKNPDAKTFYYIGLLYNKKNQYDTAIQYLDHALALEPGNLLARKNKTIALVNLKKNSEVLAQSDTILQLDSRFAKAYCYKGFAYSNIGDYPKAIENFEKAVELDPKDEESIYHLVVLYKFTGNNEKAKALEGRTHR